MTLRKQPDGTYRFVRRPPFRLAQPEPPRWWKALMIVLWVLAVPMIFVTSWHLWGVFIRLLRRQTVIEKLLARFGYVRKGELDEAWYRGRLDGQAEMRERCEYEVSAVRTQYAGIQRELDYVRKLIADNVALSCPPLIVVRGGHTERHRG